MRRSGAGGDNGYYGWTMGSGKADHLVRLSSGFGGGDPNMCSVSRGELNSCSPWVRPE